MPPEGGKLVKAREESILVDLKFAYSWTWSQGRTVTREGWVGFLGPSGETGGDSVALLAESRAGSGESGGLRVLFIPSNSSALEKHLQKRLEILPIWRALPSTQALVVTLPHYLKSQFDTEENSTNLLMTVWRKEEAVKGLRHKDTNWVCIGFERNFNNQRSRNKLSYHEMLVRHFKEFLTRMRPG